MKRIFALLLLLPVIITHSAMAEEAVPTASQDIYGWERIDTLNKDDGIYDTVNIVEDETYGYVIEAIKQSGSISNSMLGIKQRISADKLISGHTYVMEFRYKMEKYSSQYWLQAGFPWDNLTMPSSNNDGNRGWLNGIKKVEYTTSKFSNGLLVQIHSANAQAHYWIADVRVYDEEDADKTNLLVNGDFTMQYKKVENPEYNNGILTWTPPEDLPNDTMGVNIYMRDLTGGRRRLNEEPILMGEMSYTVKDIPDGSFYLDIYVVDNGREIQNKDTVATCSVLGAVDFMDYRFYHDGAEISELESGTVTVALPMINNTVTDGYDMEMIVLLKTGSITRRVFKAAYTVMPSDNIEEYTVDADIDCDIDENTHLEIYLWDNIDAMNVLRDMYTF